MHTKALRTLWGHLFSLRNRLRFVRLTRSRRRGTDVQLPKESPVRDRNLRSATHRRAPHRKLQSCLWVRTPCHHLALATALLLVLATGCATPKARPLAIQSPSSSATGLKASPSRPDLKLATFNIWGLPWWINGASSDRFVRIAGELDKLNPDFATLQEVWTRKAARSASLTNGWWIAKAAQSHSVFRRSGLVTLSRHPIVGGEFRPFHTARLPDAIVSKGALKTTIELEPGVRVNLWNVHLQAGDSASAERARCRQVEELAAWVNTADDGQIADIVSGDFNCEPGSPPYERLRKNIDAEDVTMVGAKPLYTYDGANPDGKTHLALDHIITRLRQPAQLTSTNPEMVFTAAKRQDRLSDHCGVQVGFSFTPVATVAAHERPLLAASVRDVLTSAVQTSR